MISADRALDLFAKQFNCAQAVLAACGPAENLSEPDCLRIAAAFGGGIGRLGETCGAVTGALMVLGLRFGGQAGPDPAAKAAFYERVGDLISRFKGRNTSILCRDLLGCDLSTPAGWQQAQERKVHQTVCPKYVRDAVEILDEVQDAARGAG
jgi:C_GCAxxG_C_C family probable redox protein